LRDFVPLIWISCHVFEEVKDLPEVRKQFMNARITAFRQPSMIIT